MMRWVPDLGEFQPPGPNTKIFSCQNFHPTNRGGYARSFGATATAYTAATNGVPTGAAMVSKSDGTHRLFVGSNLRIEEADGAGGWTNRSSATYTTAIAWSFAQFGDHTIATNGVNNPQVSSTGGFADLGGTPPKGRFVVVQNNVALLLNINDGTAKPDGWAASDQNNHAQWVATTTNFADSDRLYGGIGGPITAATAFRDAVIAFKNNAMYRGRFTGDLDLPWVWDFVSQTHGCPSPFGYADTEVGLVYVAEQDVMLYDGSPPRSICDDVRKKLFADVGTNISTTFCSVDEPNNLVWFWFTFTSNSGYPDRAYFWNWKTGIWGAGDAFGAISAAATPLRGARYKPFSTSPISGGTNSSNIANLVFGNDSKLYNLYGGIGAAASLEFWPQGRLDADLRLNKMRAVFVTSNKPTAASMTMQPYDAGLVSGTAQTPSMQGDFSFGFNTSARYFDNTFTIASGQNCEILHLLPEYQDLTYPMRTVSNK